MEERLPLSLAGKLTVAGLVVAAAGVVIQIISGVDFPQTFSLSTRMFGVVALCDDPGVVVSGRVWVVVRLGGRGEFWHPWPAPQRVAQDGDHVEAVLGGGGQDPADRVAVSGAVLAGEPPGDVLLHFAGP